MSAKQGARAELDEFFWIIMVLALVGAVFVSVFVLLLAQQIDFRRDAVVGPGEITGSGGRYFAFSLPDGRRIETSLNRDCFSNCRPGPTQIRYLPNQPRQAEIVGDVGNWGPAAFTGVFALAFGGVGLGMGGVLLASAWRGRGSPRPPSPTPRRINRRTFWAGYGALGLAALTLLFATHLAMEQLAFRETAITTEAQIVEMRRFLYTDGAIRYRPLFRFTLADGTEQHVLSDRNQQEPLRYGIGDRIAIRYDPQDPLSISMLGDFVGNWFGAFACLVIAAALAIVGGALVSSGRARG